MVKDLLKCKQAAFAYVGIGVVIVLLTTLFIPEAHYRSGFIPLLAGIVVLLVLACLIYRGVRWLIIILTFFATVRTGWWIYSFFSFAGEETRWVYLMNALLNIIVIIMLARAAVGTKEQNNNRDLKAN